MTRQVPFTIPPAAFPLIQQAVAQRGLIPEGFKLSKEVILQFEKERRLEPLPREGLQPGELPYNPCELLPNGVPRGIKNALVDVLGVDDEEVTLETSLQHGLGSESIDMIDIVFRLEKTYGVEVPRRALVPEDIFTNRNCVDPQTSRINQLGLDELSLRMPYANLSEFKKNPFVHDFNRLVQTVGLLKGYLEHRGVKFTSPPKTSSSRRKR